MLRAASSTSAQLAPGATASTAASWASSTASYASPLSGLWPAQIDGPRHVRTITLEDYTEVERHKPPPRQRRSRRAPVRHRRPHTRGHNRLKRHSFGAQHAAPGAPTPRPPQSPESPAAEPQDVFKQPATDAAPPRPSPPVRPHPSLERNISTNGAGIGLRKPRRKRLGSSALPSRQLRDRRSRRIESRHRHARLRGQPLRPRATAGEPHTISTCAAFDLFGGLRRVAAIGKQACRPARHGQRGARSGESGKIAKIGWVCDEKPGEPGASHLAAQRANTAEVVHSVSFITGVRSLSSESVPLSNHDRTGCFQIHRGWHRLLLARGRTSSAARCSSLCRSIHSSSRDRLKRQRLPSLNAGTNPSEAYL